jgi:predicted metal-dependent enzyme (double-stranded beta helix superfamily)
MSAVALEARRDAGLAKLAGFVAAIGSTLDRTTDERQILADGGARLADLVAIDDWLPEIYAQPDPLRYRQYLLYRDPEARFSIVSFVWGPGQATPIHDHTVWGLVGVLRGAEIAERYERRGSALRLIGSDRLEPGRIDAVSPSIGDLHRVSNAADRVSVSIHVYGADIGAIERATYDLSGNRKPFVSGYADAPLPLVNAGAA